MALKSGAWAATVALWVRLATCHETRDPVVALYEQPRMRYLGACANLRVGVFNSGG
jgi:phage terminase large subunit-like protein